MLEILLIAAIIFMAVLGISEILHRLWIFTIGSKNGCNIILSVLKDSKACEQAVAAINERRWLGDRTAFMVVGVDCGLDDYTYNNCLRLESENEDFALCSLDELTDFIKRME